MNNNDTKRLSRLTAILTRLQTKHLITASELADRFSVSKRTIYRDIRALEDAGVPILTEEGKGYALMEGYKIPPVMFTESEANALITAEQLIMKNKDSSFVKDYTDAENTQAHFIGALVENKFSEVTFGKTLAKTKQICFGYFENLYGLELLNLADKESMELDFWYLIA